MNNYSTTISAKRESNTYLHHLCEGLLYAWLTGLVLPNTNALYNLGLYAAPIAGGLYIISTRGEELKSLPRQLAFALAAFIAWGLLSCFWAPFTGTSFAEWRSNPGIAGMLACLFAIIFQNKASQRRFWYFIVLLAVALATMSIADWISIAQNLQTLIPPYPTMRHWGDRLLLCFPFLLFVEDHTSRQYLKSTARILIIVYMGLMIITGARGVWLALVFYGIAWAMLMQKTKQLGVILLSCSLVFSLSLLIPNNPLQARLDKITYTSDRTKYTWGPALVFWKDAPFFGIGHGNTAFFTKAEELAATNPDWLGNASQASKERHLKLGPHSNYLEVLSGGGVIGLMILLYLYGQTIRSTLLSRHSGNMLAAAAGIGIFAKYMIHGSVESINWKAFGVLAGLLLAALAAEIRDRNQQNPALKPQQE